MTKAAAGTDHAALLFNALGAVAIGTYVVLSFRGPLPPWAQILYLVGCLAGLISNALTRNVFSVVCFAITAAIAGHQLYAGG